MQSPTQQLLNEVAEIPGIESTLRTQLYKLDEEAELRSSGFVERNLLKYCNATGHSGFINTSGELLESPPNRKLSLFVISQDGNKSRLFEQPAQSLADVRTLVDNLLRRALFADAGPTDALARAGTALLNIRTFLMKHPDKETYPNISFECTRRLRKFAAIEVDALKAYLKFLKP